MDYRTDVAGYDGIFQRASFASNQIISIANNDSGSEILDGLKLFTTYFGWILIPNFLLFLPFGFIQFLKHMNKENNFIANYRPWNGWLLNPNRDTGKR